jgi:REP element-mobilizing transposase RayT
MTEDAFVLSEEARGVVHRTIVAHTEFRGWELLALNVRTTHVHVVVSASLDPESVMGQYKAWASRRLREAGMLAARTKVWTPHGSTKYLWDIEDTREAVHYVRNLQ